MRVTVNMYAAQRIRGRLASAPKVMLDGIQEELQEAGDRIAGEWGDAVSASGRGGANWNKEMSNVTAQVTQPKSGGFFLRLGWLNGGPAPVGGGASTWFVYHDTGYLAFGRGPRVSGLGQFLKRRSEMLDAADAIAGKVEARLRRHLRG